MKISLTELKDLTSTALKRYGYDSDEIATIREVLLYAQMRGNNQGVVKLIGAGMPKNPEAKAIEIVKETPVSARINGHQNQAMLVARKALDIVLEKASASGFAIAGTYNTGTSSGAVGYFASQIAESGLIGMVFARSPERVAVFGSYEPVFGTNPLAIAVPADPDPIVLDMSTAAMSFFGLLEAKTAGRQIPSDVAYDANGKATTIPEEAIRGALRSFDRSYKGSGLAMMAEILAGPLVGAAFCGIGNSKGNWGHLLLAIDPGLLIDPEAFIDDVKRLVQKVKSTRRLEGVTEIFVPGERGTSRMRKCLETGEIDIEDNLLEALRRVTEGG